MKRLALEDMAKTNEIARLEREKLLKEDEDRKRMEDEKNERKRLRCLQFCKAVYLLYYTYSPCYFRMI